MEPISNVSEANDDIIVPANWYAEMLGATVTTNTMARGAPQIFVDLGGMTILIRGQRPGEVPVAARPIRQFADFSSHDAWDRPFWLHLPG